ncbi:hypothetical protein NEA10_02585 [Phormidium yuhuli AB48]|uniref:Uncharacterized protein n=1 Tax=Phormidium yuhuli AB48 TaxID=2940671 RepID=A0ABY5AQY9_9CYAN|nr:hypothetical protein [Phormidium yuhuli]USR91633.1 hypothetical protein NEA10_02585 [Phormidium yuhuli AB48]
MSEYQYYEFQSLDRPLTRQEQKTLQALSSRAQVTPHGATFLYNYSDFRGDPETLVAKYFDAMLYLANWGTWQVMFRLPKALVDPEWFKPYEIEDAITVSTTADYLILNIHIQDDEGMVNWIEGEGWLPKLLPLRDDLLAGDLRLLYLAGLRAYVSAMTYSDEDPIEPPLPPNLKTLTPALKTFVEFVELNPDLVTAAAEASPGYKAASTPSLEEMLPRLTEAERDDFLLKLLRQEPHVDRQLMNRLKELAGATSAPPPAAEQKRRHFSQLVALSEEMKATRKQQENEAAQRKRQKDLEALAPKVETTWERVLYLIGRKQGYAYDEATDLLRDLRDLARLQGELPAFRLRLQRLQSDYSNRPALMKRLQSIKTE